jgi:BolA protein
MIAACVLHKPIVEENCFAPPSRKGLNAAFMGVQKFLLCALDDGHFFTTKDLRMSAEQRIKEKLMVALTPTRLDVINESHMHAGHRSSPGTGESHFRVLVVSDVFAGKSRVERHRMVNEALKGDVGGAIHALALATYAPGEQIS